MSRSKLTLSVINKIVAIISSIYGVVILYFGMMSFIYYAIYNGEINELRFKGLEGDWANFEWVDISNITNYTLFPSGIENTIVDPSMFSHFVENLLDK